MQRLDEAFEEVEHDRRAWAKVFELMCPECGGEIEELEWYATKVHTHPGTGYPFAVDVLVTSQCIVCRVSYAYKKVRRLPQKASPRKHWGPGVPN